MACLRTAWRVSMKPLCVVQPTLHSCMTIDWEILMRFHIITSWASPGKFFWKIHFPLYHRKVKKERRMFPIQYRLGLWSEKMCFCRAPVPYMDMLHWRGWTYSLCTRKRKKRKYFNLKTQKESSSRKKYHRELFHTQIWIFKHFRLVGFCIVLCSEILYQDIWNIYEKDSTCSEQQSWHRSASNGVKCFVW